MFYENISSGGNSSVLIWHYISDKISIYMYKFTIDRLKKKIRRYFFIDKSSSKNQLNVEDHPSNIYVKFGYNWSSCSMRKRLKGEKTNKCRQQRMNSECTVISIKHCWMSNIHFM
jgi:hypothetical protein